MSDTRFQTLFRCALAASVCAVALPAFAQEKSDVIITAQMGNRTEVTLGGNAGVLGNKPAEDLPFSLRSYNSALILNQQPQTLGQVLENDPSVRTTFGFGNAAEQFVIRGFVLTGDDIGYDGLYGIVPRQIVAPELYESVQVLNGASAFLNGAAPSGTGLGGSVNLMPKRAYGDLNRVTLGYTSSEHVAGSFDFARRSADGAFGMRINGAARSGDVSIDNEFRSTYVLGGAFDYNAGDLRLSLDVAYQRVKVRGLRHKVALGVLAIPAVPEADHNFAQPWTYTEMRDLFGQVKAEYDVAENVLLYAAVGARDGMEDGIYGGITVNNALTGAATGSALYVPRTDNNEAAQVGLRAKFGNAVMSNELNIGMSANWQVGRYAYDFLGGFTGFDTNLYNTAPVALPGTGFVGGDLDNPTPISRARLWSVFASNTAGFFDDRLLVTAGLRLQTIKTTGYDYNSGAVNSAYDASSASPMFGVVIKPVDGVSLFANRIQGLSKGPEAPQDTAIINPGQIFPPYETTQYEVGGKFKLGGLDLTLAAYQADQPSAYAVAGVYGIYGKQRNRGIEMGIAGEVTDGLRIIAGGSINDAVLRATGTPAIDGNKAAGVPDYLFNANVEWDLPFLPALTVTGRVVETGQQYVDRANSLKLPASTRLDVGARYVTLVADKPVTLRVNVDNVTNERDWVSAFDQFSPQLLQGAPRTYKASLSVDF